MSEGVWLRRDAAIRQVGVFDDMTPLFVLSFRGHDGAIGTLDAILDACRRVKIEPPLPIMFVSMN